MNQRARRPNLIGRKPRPVQVCPRCHQVRRMYASGICKVCWTADHPTLVGTCAGCRRGPVPLPQRSLCDRCSRVLPPGSGVDLRKRAVSTEDAETAARFHEEFVKFVAPRVTKNAFFHSRGVLNGPDRDELAAEAVAVAWEVYLQERKRGSNPLKHLRLFVRRVVGRAIFGCGVAGKMRLDDVMTRQRRDLRRVVVLPFTAVRVASRSAPDLAGELDVQAWIEKLPAPERQFVEFMSLGHTWKEAKAHFCWPNYYHVHKLLDRLWKLAHELCGE
jgi:hypothetical protein